MPWRLHDLLVSHLRPRSNAVARQFRKPGNRTMMRYCISKGEPDIDLLPGLAGCSNSAFAQQPKHNIDTTFTLTRLRAIHHHAAFVIAQRRGGIIVAAFRHRFENLPKPNVLKIWAPIPPSLSIKSNE